jgi:hypothetical protein
MEFPLFSSGAQAGVWYPAEAGLVWQESNAKGLPAPDGRKPLFFGPLQSFH